MEDESSERGNQARLRILELANMISVPMSLNAVVRLGVPDAIWQGGSNTPLSSSQILTHILPSLPSAAASTADSNNLQRLLRMLTSYGVFAEHISDDDSVRKYSLTDVGKTLVGDADGLSCTPYVLQHHHEALVRSWPLVHEAVLDPETEPFARVNGESAYDYYGKVPELNGLMQRAMSGMSVPFMRAILDGYDGFGGVRRLVDVGGSAGDCLRMIQRKYPNVKEAINFDLPEVVARAPRIPGVTHVGGDMFKSIPEADAVFMKWILATWTDDECMTLMENCCKAVPEGGKLIVCEPLLPKESDDSRRTRTLLEGDIFAMTIYKATGKYRTEEEVKKLGLSAGFTHFRAFYVDYFFTILEFTK